MDPVTAEVLGKWFDTCHRGDVGLAVATDMADLLVSAYQQETRSYHNLVHVHTCLRMVEHAQLAGTDRLVAEFALWFHDVVYDTRRDDNEAQSAALAEAWLQAVGFDAWQLVGDAIRMTAGHTIEPTGHPSLQAVHDVDLAVLGSQPDDYDEYAAQIRAEYRWVDDATFRSGRRRVVEGFLALDQIYILEPIQAQLERQARANLRRELETLGKA